MTGMRFSRAMRKCTCKRVAAAAFLLLVAAAVDAAPPVMTPAAINCISRGGNTLVSLFLKPETGWSSVRVYFRRTGLPDFYYIELRSDGGGNYWGTLPRPENGTKSADIQFAVKDAEGVETRSNLEMVDVTASCSGTLSSEQERFAHNLVVGETVMAQTGQALDGWQCTGVVSRINTDGQLRPDATCRAVALLAAATTASTRVVLPLALAGGAVAGGVIIYEREHKECSSPCPCQ